MGDGLAAAYLLDESGELMTADNYERIGRNCVMIEEETG